MMLQDKGRNHVCNKLGYLSGLGTDGGLAQILTSLGNRDIAGPAL